MSESGPRSFILKQPDGDEVERSIELLDKVLSEFEDPESLPHIEPDSPSQGHQSEDDGYMSMNGKKAAALNAAENEGNNIARNRKLQCDTKLRCEILNGVDSSDAAIPSQTTLPKARPSNVIPSKYASLPCSTPPRLISSHSVDEHNLMGSGGTVLGIGISAVHDAVLRRGAQIPETIVNEHPVTIYPGRASPAKKVPPRTLPGLIDRHRDVCRKSIDSSQELSIIGDNLIQFDSNESLDITVDDEQSKITILNKSPAINKIIFNNTVSIEPCTSQILDHAQMDDEEFSDDSLDDKSLPPPPPSSSTPTQPIVPPLTHSRSAPVSPNKRSSIAWEISINDEHINEPKPLKTAVKSIGSSNVTGSQTSVASTPCNSITSTELSCSSDWPDPPEQPICSTEDEAGSLYTDSEDVIPLKPTGVRNGTYVIRKGRDRARLFDLEAFAATVVPATDTEPESLNIEEEEYDGDKVVEENVVEENAVEEDEEEEEEEEVEENNENPHPMPTKIATPNYRHSIDLAALPTPIQHMVHSPRARLSLNLGSDTAECWASPSKNIKSTSVDFHVSSPRQTEYKVFCSKLDGLPLAHHSNNRSQTPSNNDITQEIDETNPPVNSKSNEDLNVPLMRVASLPTVVNAPPPSTVGDVLLTPRRELAPPIEEDEEQDSESQRGAPLRQIENNISALLRGDIPIVSRVDIAVPHRRPVGFRAGVHKSESAKEMLLSQNMFGPLPPSPQSSSPEETDGFPPLPPSPMESAADKFDEVILADAHTFRTPSLTKSNRYRDSMDHAPVIPPHRCTPTLNTLKTRSMDAGFTKCYKNNNVSMSPHAPGTLPQEFTSSCNSRRRIMSGAFPKRSAQSPREERRLQTSCSLPETPIFARGCDIPRTPHRRTQEMPAGGGGSRTAPRPMNGLNSSIVGIGSTLNGRQPNRCINQALASSEMLRMAGGPARGWYPKQRHNRPASTENLDRINHVHVSNRAWDSGSASRKPLTLPPNLSPNFFNKSPREALRRVTSLLIRKGTNGKDSNIKKEKEKVKEKDKDNAIDSVHRTFDTATTQSNHTHKKKGFFKSFWKKSKHYSLEQ